MTNPFQDQREFMLAVGQSIEGSNPEQYILYNNLVTEEATELFAAIREVQQAADELQRHETQIPTHTVDDLIRASAHVAKEAIDVIVVLTGYLLSMGINPDLAWQAVHESNLSKLDPETGKPIYRKDGKVQKPLTWKAPDMERVVLQSWEKGGD